MSDMKDMKEQVNIEIKEIKETEEKPMFPEYVYRLTYIFGSLFLLISFIVLVFITYKKNSSKFWLNQIAKYIVVFVILLICGCLARYCNVKVNYTRKVSHLTLVFFPYLLDKIIIDFEESIITELWTSWILGFIWLCCIEPIQKK